MGNDKGRYRVTALFYMPINGLGWNYLGNFELLQDIEDVIFDKDTKTIHDYSIYDNKEEKYIV